MGDSDPNSFLPYLDDSYFDPTSGGRPPAATFSKKGKSDKSSKGNSYRGSSMTDTGVYDDPSPDSTDPKQNSSLDKGKLGRTSRSKSSPNYSDGKSSPYSDYSATATTGKKSMLPNKMLSFTYVLPTSVPDDTSTLQTSSSSPFTTPVAIVRPIPASSLITSSLASLSLASVSAIPSTKSSTLSSSSMYPSPTTTSSPSIIIPIATSTPSYLPAIEDKNAPTPPNYTTPIVVGVIAGVFMIGMLAFAVVRMRKNRKTRKTWSTYTDSVYRDPFAGSMEQSRHHLYSA